MLKVYKRNGNLEDFNHQTLVTSLVNTGYDMNFTLNQRETELLVQDVEKAIIAFRGEDGYTSTYEIGAIVINVLDRIGYTKLANTYYKNRIR